MNMNAENAGMLGCFKEGHILSARAIKQMRDVLDQQAIARRDHMKAFEEGCANLAKVSGEYVMRMGARKNAEKTSLSASVAYSEHIERTNSMRAETLSGQGLEVDKNGGISFPGFG